jgi:hypothetical protein
MNTLPNDVARCYGIATATGWRKDCKDCLRRTCPPGDRVVRVMPTDIEEEECPLYIKPKDTP